MMASCRRPSLFSSVSVSALLALSGILLAAVLKDATWITFADARTGMACGNWTGEFHLVYDVSSSYTDDIKVLRKLAPELFASIAEAFPGAKFGVGTFSDKAMQPFGMPGDNCYKTRLRMTTDQKAAADVMFDIFAEDGWDVPESQMDALYHGVKSDTVGFSRGKTHDEHDRPILRVIILATDAPFHKRGDAKLWNSTMIDHPGDREPRCLDYDYPKEGQVRNTMKNKEVQPLFLISGEENMKIYNDLLTYFGLGGSVQPLATDSSNIVEVLLKGLEQLSCEKPTPPPPTIPPSTDKPKPTNPGKSTTTTEKTTTTTTKSKASTTTKSTTTRSMTLPPRQTPEPETTTAAPTTTETEPEPTTVETSAEDPIVTKDDDVVPPPHASSTAEGPSVTKDDDVVPPPHGSSTRPKTETEAKSSTTDATTAPPPAAGASTGVVIGAAVGGVAAVGAAGAGGVAYMSQGAASSSIDAHFDGDLEGSRKKLDREVNAQIDPDAFAW